MCTLEINYVVDGLHNYWRGEYKEWEKPLTGNEKLNMFNTHSYLVPWSQHKPRLDELLEVGARGLVGLIKYRMKKNGIEKSYNGRGTRIFT